MSMRAAIRSRRGIVFDGAAPLPRAPRKGEVAVKVQAASANPVDYKLPSFVAGKVSGTDFAGEVTAVGKSVTGLSVGDQVFGFCSGSHAEHAVTKASVVAKRPSWLRPPVAATLGVAYLTGLQGLRDKCELRKGGSVLVIGASGGCGVAACQLARAMGASEVVGVCSKANAGLATRAGATRVVDYKTTALAEACEAGSFDVIYDAATGSGGGEAYTKQAMPLLKPNGQYCQLNGSAGTWIRGLTGLLPKGQHLFLTKAATSELEALLEYMKPPTSSDETPRFVPELTELPLSEEGVDEAFATLKSRRAKGKLVFVM